MIKKVATTTKKFAAVGALALGMAGFGLFADISTAAADPIVDTGSYDELTDLEQEGCWGEVASPPAAFEVGDPESAGCEHSRMAGSYGPNAG